MTYKGIAMSGSSCSMWIMVTSKPHVQLIKDKMSIHFKASKIIIVQLEVKAARFLFSKMGWMSLCVQ